MIGLKYGLSGNQIFKIGKYAILTLSVYLLNVAILSMLWWGWRCRRVDICQGYWGAAYLHGISSPMVQCGREGWWSGGRARVTMMHALQIQCQVKIPFHAIWLVYFTINCAAMYYIFILL